jgi:hypothetical protein
MDLYSQFFRPSRFPPVVNELKLLRQAGLAYPELSYADLSTAVLAQITRKHTTDFATALFYDRIRRSPEHGPFISSLEAIEPDLANLPRLSGKVFVAPAAFYREYPDLGADGQLVREIASDFGLETALLPVSSIGTVTSNAALIAQVLAAESATPVILVSLSKGGAEARLALEADRTLARKVRVWIQIGGLIRGSPVVNALLDGRWWQRGLLCAYLRYLGAGSELLCELRYGCGSILGRQAIAPAGMRVINVISCPLNYHMVGNRRPRYLYLAGLGPNDGSTLLRDAIVEPGLVYPVWGADHYFRTPEIPRLVYRLFLYLNRIGLIPSVAESSQEKRAWVQTYQYQPLFNPGT